MSSSRTAWEHHLDTSFMDDLTPVNQLSQKARARLFKKAHFQRLKRGDKLSGVKEQHWLIYAVQGLLTEAGAEAKTPSHKVSLSSPLFHEDLAATVDAMDDSLIIRFDRKLYELLQEEDEQAGYGIDTIDVSRTEQGLFNNILEAYKNNNIKLPGLPEIAIKVRQAVSAHGASISEVARIIETEPALTAKIINTANSARFLGAAPARSIFDAISRLGFSTTQQLATAHAIANVFSNTGAIIRGELEALYNHSLHIAVISYYLTKTRTRLNPDYALLAGIVHDIGVIPILAHIEQLDYPVSKEEIDEIINKLRGVIGGLVLSKWEFDNDLIEVAEEAEQWTRFSDNQLDYCDVITIAHWCDKLTRQEDEPSPAREEIPAFRKIGMEYMELEEFQAILDDASDEIQELKELFS